jgi:hypothetical protein
MSLRFTQPLTEISARNVSEGNARPARKAGNLAVICEQIVCTMWEPQHLTTL